MTARTRGLPEPERVRFMLGRRLGWIERLDELDAPGLRAQVNEVVGRLESQGLDVATVVAELRARAL